MENQRNTLLTWAYYCQGKSMDELRQSLLLATLELETTRLKAQEELKMRDDQLNHLKALCTEAIRERDEARDKCQRLVFERLLFQQQQFHLQQQQQQLHLQQQQQQQQCQQNAPLSGISSIEDEPRRGLDSNNGFSSPTSFISPRFLSPIGTPMKRVLINMKGYLEEVGHLTKLNPQDAWLPITESRNGNAHYAAFHNLNAGVVFQALVLPVAFSFLGWSWGILSLTIAYFWQLYTLWILVQLHEAVPGKRYNRYVELAQAAFGERLGVWLASLQFICQQEQLDFNRSANDLPVGMAQESELRPRLNSRSDYTHTLHPPSHFPSL